MNRKMKFRWLGTTDKKMHYFDLFDCQSAWMDPDQEASEVVQCTGLKDKNGVEIYEGDIIKKYHCDIKSLGELKTDGMNWWVEDELKETRYERMDVTSGEFCEVIGNIYENPELLDKEKE